LIPGLAGGLTKTNGGGRERWRETDNKKSKLYGYQQGWKTSAKIKSEWNEGWKKERVAGTFETGGLIGEVDKGCANRWGQKRTSALLTARKKPKIG